MIPNIGVVVSYLHRISCFVESQSKYVCMMYLLLVDFPGLRVMIQYHINYDITLTSLFINYRAISDFYQRGIA
jgi:hypothetical protein